MPSTIAAAPEDTADDAAASSAPVGTNTEVPTAETAAKSVDETQESANIVAAEDDTPPENPVEKYVRPWSIAVGMISCIFITQQILWPPGCIPDLPSFQLFCFVWAIVSVDSPLI
jgi:hypothetical protein